MKNNDIRYLETTLLTRSTTSKDTLRKIVSWQEHEEDIGEYSKVYDRTVSLHLERGDALLTMNNGEKIEVKSGDFIRIEKGSSIQWEVGSSIKSKYMYHDSYKSAESRKAQVYWSDT